MSAAWNQLKVNPDVILTEMNDGTGVLLNLKTKFYFALNTTGVFVWKELELRPAQTRSEIAGAIHRSFRVELDRAERDLDDMVRELLDEELVSAVSTSAQG